MRKKKKTPHTHTRKHLFRLYKFSACWCTRSTRWWRVHYSMGHRSNEVVTVRTTVRIMWCSARTIWVNPCDVIVWAGLHHSSQTLQLVLQWKQLNHYIKSYRKVVQWQTLSNELNNRGSDFAQRNEFFERRTLQLAEVQNTASVCQSLWCQSLSSQLKLLHLISSHLGFVHPLQDVALHQCLPSSSVCCLPNPGGSLLLCYVILPSSAWSSSRPLPSPWLPLCASPCPPIVL